MKYAIRGLGFALFTLPVVLGAYALLVGLLVGLGAPMTATFWDNAYAIGFAWLVSGFTFRWLWIAMDNIFTDKPKGRHA